MRAGLTKLRSGGRTIFMRSISVALWGVLILGVACGYAQPTGTADWIKVNRPIDRMVTVPVASVTPGSRPLDDGRMRFSVLTADGQDFYGSIDVVVSAEEAPRFARRYGTNTRTRTSRGDWVFDTTPLRALVVENSNGTLSLEAGVRPPSNGSEGPPASSGGSSTMFYVSRVNTQGASEYETQPNLVRLFGLLNYDLKSKGRTELTQNEFLSALKRGERYAVVDQGRRVLLVW